MCGKEPLNRCTIHLQSGLEPNTYIIFQNLRKKGVTIEVQKVTLNMYRQRNKSFFVVLFGLALIALAACGNQAGDASE